MPFTYLTMEVANVARPEITEKVDFLIDLGAIYSIVPRAVLERLGIQPLITEEFTLANGAKIKREKGGAVFKYKDRIGVAGVIFGEEGDSQSLGALSLEALGLSLDTGRRELTRVPLVL
ncbi:MAG: hypothetical protein QOG91_7 [Candidatus Parcubacteria bacterium]|nr:hypothetical protein [Candidatus Parcubacteria bacterium]